MDVEHADRFVAIDDEQGRDAMFFEQSQRFVDQRVRTDRPMARMGG